MDRHITQEWKIIINKESPHFHNTFFKVQTLYIHIHHVDHYSTICIYLKL